MSRKFKITWFVISFLFGSVINEINLYFVKSENPQNIRSNEKSTMYGYTIYNIDHEWYLPQIKNIIAGNGYTLEPNNPEMMVRRTPLYPLFYGLHYYLFGEEKCFLVIRYTQLFLLALAAILMGMSVYNFSWNMKWAKCCTVLFSFSPFIFINAYHTVTEGLTPFLVVFSFYQFSRYYALPSKRYLIYTGIALGFAILNRPLTGFLLPVFLIALLEKNIFDRKVLRKIIISSSMIMIPVIALLTPWTIRNYIVTGGEFIPFEKIYYEDPMDFGRGHLYFRRWISCWENPALVSAEQFSSTLRNNISSGKQNNDSVITAFLNEMPPYALQGYTKEDVKKCLDQLNACFVEKYELKLKDPNITRRELSKLKSEDQVKNSFSQLISKFSSNSPSRYYFITPFKMIGQGVFQSNTLFYGSLNPSARQFNYFQIAIKSFMYLLNVCLFFSALFFLFVRKVAIQLRWITVAFGLLTFISLVYFFNRYLDARYLLPIYPFLYVSLSYFISQWRPKIRSESNP